MALQLFLAVLLVATATTATASGAVIVRQDTGPSKWGGGLVRSPGYRESM